MTLQIIRLDQIWHIWVENKYILKLGALLIRLVLFLTSLTVLNPLFGCI